MHTHLTIALTGILLFTTACRNTASAPTEGITDKGIAPIFLGTPLSELPPQAEGLYDEFEVLEFEDEMGDIYSRTYVQFRRNGEVVIEADLNPAENQTVSSIFIFDPAIQYRGIGAGTPIHELLKTEAKCYIYGNYQSCSFDAFFRLGNICFDFDYFNGKGFSRTGQKKLFQTTSEDLHEEIFSAPDFQEDAKITNITIKPL